MTKLCAFVPNVMCNGVILGSHQHISHILISCTYNPSGRHLAYLTIPCGAIGVPQSKFFASPLACSLFYININNCSPSPCTRLSLAQTNTRAPLPYRIFRDQIS